MMTIELALSKLNVKLEDVPATRIKDLQELIDLYNKGFEFRKSIYLTDEELFFREAKGVIYGYLPEIEGIIYKEIPLY